MMAEQINKWEEGEWGRQAGLWTMRTSSTHTVLPTHAPPSH